MAAINTRISPLLNWRCSRVAGSPPEMMRNNAAERKSYSETLSDTETVFVHDPGNDDDDDRNAGVDQYRIYGGGGLDGHINQTVEAGHPNDALDDDELLMFYGQLALQEMAESETAEHEQSNHPAPERGTMGGMAACIPRLRTKFPDQKRVVRIRRI